MPRLFTHPTDPPAAGVFEAARAKHAANDLLLAECAGWDHSAVIRWGHDDYRTSFRALWDDEALFVRYDCQDHDPWWTITERDGRLWEEEVVEIFLDPARTGLDYAELEISPANVVCDLRVVTPWPQLRSDPAWDVDNLVSRVHVTRAGVDGAVTWAAVAAVPFASLATLGREAGARVPPAEGDRWRFNVFRIKRPGGPARPEDGVIYAAWSVPDGPSFHVPDAFRDLVFAR